MAVFQHMVKMPELLVDPEIRTWVFFPIVLITFLVGIIRHYAIIWTGREKKIELKDIIETQTISRGRLLILHGLYLTKDSFETRRDYFNNETYGCYKTLKDKASEENPMRNPGALSEMLKLNMTECFLALPMLFIAGWINYMFSGFIATKVPFPLTFSFKPMLQRGIELTSLDPAWVSSVSWYFLNVFGLRSIYTLVLGEEPCYDVNQFIPMPPTTEINTEWEALEMYQHKWELKENKFP